MFQRDATAVHKARTVKMYFDEVGVEELKWPAQSPVIITFVMNCNGDCALGFLA